MTLFRFLLRHRCATGGLLVLTLCGTGCGEAPDATTSSRRGEDEDEATGGAGKPRLRDGGLDAGTLPRKRPDAGPVVTVEASGTAGGPIEKCPDDLVCNRLGLEMQIPSLPEAVCQRENLPPRCPASGQCADIGLPQAQCISVAVGARSFSYCQQPCVPPAESETDPEPPASDAGAASGSPHPSGDAERDAGASVIDAGRDAGRGAGSSRRSVF